MSDQTAFFNAIGMSIAQRIKDRIRENRVKPADETIKKKIIGTDLLVSSRLMKSIHHKVAGDTIYIGTNVIYAQIHHLGGKAGRGRKVNIPARPYMFLDDADRSFIQQRIKLFMEKQLTKK